MFEKVDTGMLPLLHKFDEQHHRPLPWISPGTHH
jgi:hypothetical protein